MNTTTNTDYSVNGIVGAPIRIVRSTVATWTLPFRDGDRIVSSDKPDEIDALIDGLAIDAQAMVEYLDNGEEFQGAYARCLIAMILRLPYGSLSYTIASTRITSEYEYTAIAVVTLLLDICMDDIAHDRCYVIVSRCSSRATAIAAEFNNGHSVINLYGREDEF